MNEQGWTWRYFFLVIIIMNFCNMDRVKERTISCFFVLVAESNQNTVFLLSAWAMWLGLPCNEVDDSTASLFYPVLWLLLFLTFVDRFFLRSNVVSVSCLLFFFFDSNDLSGILFPFFSPLDCTQETEPDWQGNDIYAENERETNWIFFFLHKKLSLLLLFSSVPRNTSVCPVYFLSFSCLRSWYWYFSCKRFTYSNFWLFTTLVQSILTWFATLLLFHSFTVLHNIKL